MDVLTKENRHKNMKAVRGRDTKPELYLRRLLFGMGIRYRVSPPGKAGHPDMWLSRYNTAIFVHGCFWHAHEGCRYFKIPEDNREFWVDKFKKNKERDFRVCRDLMNEGVRVLILWECLIKKMKTDIVVKDAAVLEIFLFLNSDRPYLDLSWSNKTGELLKNPILTENTFLE